MENLLNKFKLIVNDKGLLNKILFVLFALVLFRLLANIPIPAAAGLRLDDFLANNQALGFLNLLTGGGLSAISIVMLGVGPYITSSIIMQLLTMMSDKLKALYHEEGELGKKKFSQYSRLLTIPLAFMQGYGILVFLQKQGAIGSLVGFDLLLNVIIVAAGSILLMWIGELISEFGIGNGVSLIIFAGIVASLPSTISQALFTFDVSQIPMYLGFIVAAVAIVAGVVIVTEAERPIPITYAKRVRGMKVYGGISTYLPLRVNQAGVIPIIFALSILIFPQVLVSFLSQVDNTTIAAISSAIERFITNPWFSSTLYFFLELATEWSIHTASFLGAIAVLPLIMQSLTQVGAFAIGGTALLIVVSVVLDLVKKIEAQVSMREY